MMLDNDDWDFDENVDEGFVDAGPLYTDPQRFREIRHNIDNGYSSIYNESEGYGSDTQVSHYLEHYYSRPLPDFKRLKSYALLGKEGSSLKVRQKVGADEPATPGVSVVLEPVMPDGRRIDWRLQFDRTPSPQLPTPLNPYRRRVYQPKWKKVRRSSNERENLHVTSDEECCEHLIMNSRD